MKESFLYDSLMRIWYSFFLLLLLAQALFAQAPASARHVADTNSNTANSLLEAFQHGHFHGHFRSYFMATDNAGQLTDYYAQAVGGGLHFSSAPWYGFQFGIGGIFNYNLASSDLSLKDPNTGALNRYELGLFDIEDPKNKRNLDRMEEFWLRYERGKTRITLGQQSIQTPFINYQDGRMRPTAEAGAWLESRKVKGVLLEGGWLWRISPRSTVDWYSIGESIGLYPRGLNPDGTASGYQEHLKSKGIGLLGLTKTVHQHLKLQVWNQYVENIFNTVFAQADITRPIQGGYKLLAGLQYTHQNALNHGGHEDQTKTYFARGAESNVFSGQVGAAYKQWQVLLAHTRVTNHGRFLSPREWGREPFYTFLQRERIEGSGASHASTLKLNWKHANQRLQIGLGTGYYALPDVKETEMNKYAFPAFYQINTDIRYTFGGAFKGLSGQVLYVYKGRVGEIYGQEKYAINKVDMSHFNLILNYTY